jgi:transcriptional regulator with XRE-family HTH domain
MTPEEAQQLGVMLRTKRETSGLTAREMARRAGVDVGTVTRIEQGQILAPRPDNLTALGDVLSIPAADLFATANWLPKDELPTLTPYLRAKYKEFPDEAVDEMGQFFARLAKEHGVQGPEGREDER